MDLRACFKPSPRLDIVSIGRRKGLHLGYRQCLNGAGELSRLPLRRDFWQEEAWVSDYQAGEMVDRGSAREGSGNWRFSRFVYWEEQMRRRRLQCRRGRRAREALWTWELSKVTEFPVSNSEGEARRRERRDLGLHFTQHSQRLTEKTSRSRFRFRVGETVQADSKLWNQLN